jgi:glycerol-3-phosphate dehydrogenase subunit C
LGVETIVEYPGCCGMPFLEQADLKRVSEQAEKVSAALIPYVEKGYDIIAMTASCGLMFKFEWPLIVPGHENVKKLSAATFDIDEYVVDIAKKHGLPEGMKPVDGGVSVHLACHARAQNMGPKAAEMLKLIPQTKVDVIERCSGHGGTFGVLKPTFEVAMKVGKPAARTANTQGNAHVVSDCPLAAKHLKQGMRALDEAASPSEVAHPIELMAKAYGLVE